MSTAEQYVEKLATLPREEKRGDQVAAGVEALKELEPALFADNALLHFKCPERERNKQVDFLKEVRKQLTLRYGELTDLGHEPANLSLVEIDQHLQDLDVLLEVGGPDEVQALLQDRLKGLCEPPTILPKIAAGHGQMMEKIREIQSTPAGSESSASEGRWQEFRVLRQALKDDLGSLGHVRLRTHLSSLLLDPAEQFGPPKN